MNKILITFISITFFYITGFGQSSYKTYKNDVYGIQFNYPENFLIDEHFDILVAQNIRTEGCPIEFKIKIYNPKRSKEVYDCCYTPEEIELFGQIPSIEIWFRNLECLRFKREISPNVEAVIHALKNQGYDTTLIKKSTSLIPRGKYKDARTDTWILKDRCDTCILLNNNETIIKCTRCPEGVVENQMAIIVHKGDYTVHIRDDATEYPNDFDIILNSITLIEEIHQIDYKNEDLFINFRKYDIASQRKVFESQLKNYNLKELRLMRNEIFAAYGYIFKSDDLREYFESKNWCNPSISNINEIMLTETELENIETLLKLEKNK
jgi:hypothetical protein